MIAEQETLHRPASWLTRLWPVNGATHDVAALDGLRGVAVLLTVGYHIFLQLHDNPATKSALLEQTTHLWAVGAHGVDLFFVLSGFLLFRPYVKAIRSKSALPSTRKFYIRRALRILPAYWVSLALLIIFFPQDAVMPLWYDIVIHIPLLHNWEWTTRTSINASFWTMAVESQFYVLLPLFAIVGLYFYRRPRLRWFLIPLTGVVLASYRIFLWIVGHILPNFTPHISMLELSKYIGVFLIGMGCAILVTIHREDGFTEKQAFYVCRLCSYAGYIGLLIVVLYTMFYSTLPHFEKFHDLFGILIYGIGFGGFLLGALYNPQWQAVLAHPALRLVGILSYSLYIWNWPLLNHMNGLGFGNTWLAMCANVVVVGVVILPVSFVSYTLVERPFIGLRRAAH